MTARLSWVAYIQYFVIGILLYLFVVSSTFAVISGLLGLALGKGAAQTVLYGLTLLYLAGCCSDLPVAVPIWTRPVYGITAVCFRGRKAFAVCVGRILTRHSISRVFSVGLHTVILSICSTDTAEASPSKTCTTGETGAHWLMNMPSNPQSKQKGESAMRMLIGIGTVFGLVFIAYLNRHNNIGPAIMMALVFPIALVAMAGAGRRRDWYDD